jgi:metal-sulfur cluster biosynthetic enzyme
VATIDMTLTSAACPLTDVIEEQAASALEGLVTDFRINWVWLPPWGPDKITEDGRATPRLGLQRLTRPAARASLP